MKRNIKKIIYISLGITIIILLIIIGIILWKRLNEVTVVPMRTPFVMDSEKEEQVRKFWRSSNFYYHKGKLELTIVDSEIYENPELAGISDIYLYDKMPSNKDICFLLITYQVKNIDATLVEPSGFRTGMFRLIPYHLINKKIKMPKKEVTPDAVYSSVFKKNVEEDNTILGQPKEGQYYQLEKGEVIEIQEGYFIDKEIYNNNEIILSIETGQEGMIKTVLEIVK